ncbi:MAG: hypothetical protein HY296_02765 [Thaumarchaeota archaeon]|nr:hypothetical protein [Nitrososphaerota archaeon]
MPTITVRISDEEKKQLSRKGEISESVRKAISRYLEDEETNRVLDRLAELQRKNPVSTSPEETVRLIKTDRTR